MDARFRVEWTLTIASRPLFFPGGETLGGTVRTGMVAAYGAPDDPFVRRPIEAVESADSLRAGSSWVVLGVRPADPAEPARWKEMAWEGAELRIPAAPSCIPAPAAASARGWTRRAARTTPAGSAGERTISCRVPIRAAFAAVHPHLPPQP